MANCIGKSFSQELYAQLHLAECKRVDYASPPPLPPLATIQLCGRGRHNGLPCLALSKVLLPCLLNFRELR